MILQETKSTPFQTTNDYFERYFGEIKFYLAPLFDYKQGNCHNVNHYASLILRSYGVPHNKIWIYAPARYKEHSKQVIKLHDPNFISPNGELSWGYHVALLLRYEGSEYVFDLFLDAHKPLTISTWLEKMQAKQFYVDITNPDDYLFFTEESELKKNGLFNGQYFTYEGLCKEQNWLAKGLAINETAVAFYSDQNYHFRNNTNLSADYRLFVGRINNFESVIRDATTNKRMTPTFQQKHSEIIAEYREIYEQNLDKWTDKINSFL